MFKFLKTPQGLITAGLIILALFILISYNWKAIQAWFTPAASNGEGRLKAPTTGSRQECIVTGDGTDCIYYGLLVPCAECTKRGIPLT